MTFALSINRFFLTICLLAVWSPAASAQENFMRPPDGLETQGIPPIPSSIAKGVLPYLVPYGLPLAGWDPVKREIWLKLTSPSGSVSRIETPAGQPKIWISLNAGNIYDIYFDPKAEHLIYNKDTNGNEAFQMYLYNIQTKQSTLLSDGKSRNTEFLWSHAGDRIIYCRSLASEGPGVSIFMMNPFDPKSNRLLVKSEGNYLKAQDWSPDDRIAVFCEYFSHYSSRLWLLDVVTGKKTLLLSSKGQVSESPQFSKDSKGIYLITDVGSDLRKLGYFDLRTKKLESITEGINWDIDDFALSPNGKLIAFTTNEDGFSKLYFLDTSTRKKKLVTDVPVGVISDLKWHNNSTDLAFNLKSSLAPNIVYSIDAKTEKVESWSRNFMGGLEANKLIQPEVFRWKSIDGRQIPGLLYRPPAKFTGKRPVIIYFHGGPTVQYRPEFGYDRNYFLNELGIAMIYPNYRGSYGYGKKYLDSDNGLRREDAMKDIEALLNWIDSQSDLDSKRVMVWGGSYGGYMALTAAYKFGDRIRCALSDNGIANLATFIERMEASRRDLQRAEFGDERIPKFRRYMEKTAPLTNAAKIKIPLFVVHGKNDPRVSINEATSIAQAVSQNGTAVWSLFANNEGHTFTRPHNWSFRLNAIIVFALEYLLEK